MIRIKKDFSQGAGDGSGIMEKLLKNYGNLPEVREEAVNRARERLESGFYDKEEIIREAARSFYYVWSPL